MLPARSRRVLQSAVGRGGQPCSGSTGRAKVRASKQGVRGDARMARIEDRAPATATGDAPLNDDIGEELRLRMYRMQVEIREAEQRAYDLFLQNLVKGTSHLSLGQEAVATGFAAANPVATASCPSERWLVPFTRFCRKRS